MTRNGGGIDFAHPNTPRLFRALNIAARPFARRLLSLAPADLMRAAQRKTGLHDFGPTHFREGLTVLADALHNEGQLHPAGRLLARTQLIDLLATRLRVQDLLARRPEIRDERIEGPIVVLGLPRTGTTLLQRLIAQDSGLRSLPYWEGLAPIPLGDPAQRPAADPRIKRAEQGLKILHWVAPAMIAMHEMEALAPDEEILLLAVDFATMLFEASYRVPSYGRWYVAHDLTASYAYLRTLLQVLQWYRRGERWVLKSPQHLEQLSPLLAVFPDATLVQTHRDPVKVTASVCSMTAYGRRMNSDHIDLREIGAYWASRLEQLLRRGSEDRPASASDQFVDVQFGELMADPIGTVQRIYAAAGRHLSAPAEQAMRAFLAANPRGKHGVHNYRLEDFGLDAAERRAALRFYQQRFNVPDE